MGERGLTQEEQKAQAERCPCRGSDDYCPCQNVPDAITRKAWGLEPARRDSTYSSLASRGNPTIPTAMFNVADLLRQIADGRDPDDDIAGTPLLAYWQRTARTYLPALVEPSPLDEAFHRLLDFARWSAHTLRQLRQEYRSPSSNFPTLASVPYAQDAASVIEQLVSAIEARATAAPPPPTQHPASELLPCPFCGGEMQLRCALWPSEGDTDAVIHNVPGGTSCPIEGAFSIGTADEGKSVSEAWNQRVPPSREEGLGASEADLRSAIEALEVAVSHHGEGAPSKLVDEAWERIDALLAGRGREEGLREALEPFAKVGDSVMDLASKPDHAGLFGYNEAILTYGDFRRARRALSHAEGGEDAG